MHHMMQRDEQVLFGDLKRSGYHVWMNGRNDLLPAQNPNAYVGYADEVAGVTIPRKPVSKREYRDITGENSGKGRTKKKGPGIFDLLRIMGGGKRPTPDQLESGEFYSFYAGKVEDTSTGLGGLFNDRVSVDRAIDYLERHGGAGGSQPFCCFIGLGAPHPPYRAPEPYFSAIDRDALPPQIAATEKVEGEPAIMKGIRDGQNCDGWTEQQWNELRATYLAMVMQVDDLFGRIVSTLKEQGLYENTAIFILSDHGDYTGDYGIVEKNQNTFQDCLTNVPLIVKPPSEFPCAPGVREDTLVELIDFYATCAEYAGFTPRWDHFGRSLQPCVAGDTDVHREAVYCEGGRRMGEPQASELESNPTLDPAHQYYPRLRLQASEDGEHGKATMCRTDRYKYVLRFYEKDELYDLESDPQELRNRIDDPELGPVAEELRLRLLRWYQETCDVVPKETDSRFGPFEIEQLLMPSIRNRLPVPLRWLPTSKLLTLLAKRRKKGADS